MKGILLATALFTALGTGAALADNDCDVPMAEWQPREALQQKLQGEGWTVTRIKTDDGCYEVDAVDNKGQRVEAKYDPKTFELVEFKRKR